MQKTLIIINGSLGVGKTTIAEKLFYSIANSGWIDPDQTWWSNRAEEKNEDIFPFILDNTIHCVNNYIKYNLNPVIISWFFPLLSQIEIISNNILEKTKLLHFMLTADKNTLIDRHMQRDDNRPYSDWMMLDESQVFANTIKVKTDNISIEQTMNILLNKILSDLG